VPTRAKGAAGARSYLSDPHAGVMRANGLFVLTMHDATITAITRLGDLGVVPYFGLPRTLLVWSCHGHGRGADSRAGRAAAARPKQVVGHAVGYRIRGAGSNPERRGTCLCSSEEILRHRAGPNENTTKISV
jgi:hypothetical protein